MPFMFCNINGRCTVSSRNDYSYWLATDEPMTAMMGPFEGPIIGKYVSRCSVCETPSKTIAVHSQNTTIPDCPVGWTSMNIGYSFAMASGAGAQAAGQDLQSPGSCLPEFRASPLIECHGNGLCNYYATGLAFYMSSIAPNQQFQMPMKVTNKQRTLKENVSRCNVCMRQYSR